MALQLAATAKAASNAANIAVKAALSSLVMTVIDTAITAESTKITDDSRSYSIVLDFDGDVNGRTKPVEIIQSDNSRITAEDVESALILRGYTVAYRGIGTRDGKNDKVRMSISWADA